MCYIPEARYSWIKQSAVLVSSEDRNECYNIGLEFFYTNNPLGSFAPFPFMVPAVFDLDFENFKACIIGDGNAPISFTSFTE